MDAEGNRQAQVANRFDHRVARILMRQNQAITGFRLENKGYIGKYYHRAKPFVDLGRLLGDMERKCYGAFYLLMIDFFNQIDFLEAADARIFNAGNEAVKLTNRGPRAHPD